MKTKTYIITGVTSGIGEALIKHLAQDNIIFAGYRDKSKLEKLTEISTNIYPFYIDCFYFLKYRFLKYFRLQQHILL